MSAQTCKRRRRQAMNNYTHIPKLRRPRFTKRSTDALAQKEANYRERQKARQSRMKK